MDKLPESPFELNTNSATRYYQGKLNFLIRLYYFFQEGLNQANNGRNIIYSLILIGGYLGYKSIDGLHFKQFLLLGGIGLGAVIIITVIGWFWMIRAKKSAEYFTLKYTTVFSKYGVQMQEEQ